MRIVGGAWMAQVAKHPTFSGPGIEPTIRLPAWQGVCPCPSASPPTRARSLKSFLKILITLDIVLLLLEFISKEKKGTLKDLCLTQHLLKIMNVSSVTCTMLGTKDTKQQNRHRPCTQGAYSLIKWFGR